MLCEQLKHLVRCCDDPLDRHACLDIVCRIAARRLGYDSRMCPTAALPSLGAARAVHALFQAMAGDGLSDVQCLVLGLPPFLGGLGVRPLTTAYADASFVACERAVRAVVTAAAAQLGRPFQTTPTDVLLAGAAVDRLRGAGIDVGAGRIDFTAEARSAYEASPWAADMPAAALFDFHCEVDDLPSSTVPADHEGLGPGTRRRTAARCYRGLAGLAAATLATAAALPPGTAPLWRRAWGRPVLDDHFAGG